MAISYKINWHLRIFLCLPWTGGPLGCSGGWFALTGVFHSPGPFLLWSTVRLSPSVCRWGSFKVSHPYNKKTKQKQMYPWLNNTILIIFDLISAQGTAVSRCQANIPILSHVATSPTKFFPSVKCLSFLYISSSPFDYHMNCILICFFPKNNSNRSIIC